MDTLSITLSESMKEFAEQRANEGGYASVSEYVNDLILADRRRLAEERLDALLLEGLDSGPPMPTPPDYLETKKRELIEKYAKKQANNGQ